MNKILIKYSIVVVASLAVLYPLWVRLQSLYWSWNLSSIVLNIFPLFGTTSSKHMEQDLDLFSFTLSGSECEQIMQSGPF